MVQTPTPQAGAIFLCWLPLVLLLFLWLPRHRAALLSFLLGVLYLPSKAVIYVPLMPTIDRALLASIALFIAVLFLGRSVFKGVQLDRGSRLFVLILMITNVVRVMANREALHYGPVMLEGLQPQTAVTFMISDYLLLVLPFQLGIAFGRKPEWRRDFHRTWIACAAIYSLFALIEVRLSPQMNVWVYGYFQHSWLQMQREGGFRPIVFMEHSLELALFIAGSALLAAAAAKHKEKIWGFGANFYSYAFLGTVILTKCFAASTYGVVGSILIRWMGARARLLGAAFIVAVVLLNPISRTAGWVTTETVVDTAAFFSEDRSLSLKFRMDNEDLVLEKVRERLWTGWGGFGRIRAYDERTGEDLTVIDGAWLIQFASGGIPRFVGLFGLLCWPILRAWREAKKVPDQAAKAELATHALIAAFFILDLIPNGLFNHLAFMLSGFVLGNLASARQTSPAARTALAQRYSRPPPAMPAGAARY